MALRFRYYPVPVSRPAVSLGGRWVRPQPRIIITLIGPAGTLVRGALLDTGADDTVFHESFAARIGVDLSNAPRGEARGVSTTPIPVRYAEVTLRLAAQTERREWKAWVAFTPVLLRLPMLGFAGCLQFFTATFHGDREEVELTVNRLYPGT